MLEQDARLFRTVRLAAIAMVISIALIAGVSEYLLRAGVLAEAQGHSPAGDTLEIIRPVLALVAAGFVTLAQVIKRAVAAGKPKAMLSFVKGVMRNIHHRGEAAYGPSVILIPIALSEAVAVFGLVLLVLSGGVSRLVTYLFFLVSLASALAVLPDDDYGTKVIELDAAVRRERGEGSRSD